MTRPRHVQRPGRMAGRTMARENPVTGLRGRAMVGPWHLHRNC
jgi:hypothetical protein